MGTNILILLIFVALTFLVVGQFTMWNTLKRQKKAVETQIEESNEKAHNHLNNFMSNALDKHQENMETFIEATGNNFSKRIEANLDSVINSDKKEISEWLKKSEDKSPAERIEMLESAISKFPWSQLLVEKYYEDLKSYLNSPQNKVKKSALERGNRTIRMHLDHVKPNDYEKARKIFEEIIHQGEVFMSENYDLRYKQTENTLEKMESIINEMSNDLKEYDDYFDELSSLDKEVDKSFVRKVGKLFKWYEDISGRIVALTQKTSDDLEAIRKYNKDVVDELRSLENTCSELKEAKEKIDVWEFSDAFAGWNLDLFFHSTNVYYQTVYQEAFQLLDSEDKPLATKQLIEREKERQLQ